MQDAGMVMYTTHADESMPTAKTLPLIVLLQDLLACQDQVYSFNSTILSQIIRLVGLNRDHSSCFWHYLQDPRVEYQQADKLQDLVHAMKSCNGLVPGTILRQSYSVDADILCCRHGCNLQTFCALMHSACAALVLLLMPCQLQVATFKSTRL